VKKIRAFILAAGLGERLRPISDHIPKPLLPILGKSALERILDRISSLQVERIGINLHHKSHDVTTWIEQSRYSERIKLFQEHTLLGTGGALKNAAALLGQSVFLVHNADIISNIPLELLIEKHLREENAVTLAVHEYPRHKSLWIDTDGNVKYIGTQLSGHHRQLRHVSFTGIAVYSPLFLGLLPHGVSSVVNYWQKAIALHHSVGTMDCTGCEWSDIGTPGSYAATVFQFLEKSGSSLYVHPSAECDTVVFEGYAVIEEGVHLTGRTMIKDSILLSGFKANADATLEKVIAGPEYEVDIELPYIMLNNQSDILSSRIVSEFITSSSDKTVIRLVGSGGSDRKYYRIREGDRSAILMQCPPHDRDYERQMLFTAFFRTNNVPVPALIASDDERMQVLFEDIGDTTLYAWLQCRKSSESVEQIYKRVLDILVAIHAGVTSRSNECPELQNRLFDVKHLRWETTYFLEQFVKGVRGIIPRKESRLDDECARLAATVNSFRKAVIHRDFQSQNIMITGGNTIRVLDYQGARMGPPAYDLASLLWDPYYRLDNDTRIRLINYYLEKMNYERDNSYDESEIRQTLLFCRLQRHMQALGAYGFLSRKKGKTYFMKYVPSALEYLQEEAASAKDVYPELYTLVKKLL
jgi:NDP-sugar pyrophosphorylase family protein/thiamine kinase-like enzyme